MPDLAQAAAFLHAVYGTADKGYIHLWSLRHDDAGEEYKATTWLPLPYGGSPDVTDNTNWYVSTGISPTPKSSSERMKAAECIGIPGLTADIDLAGPAHSKANLPKTKEEAIAVLREAGLPEPTITVESGHGLQWWWLFRETWYFDTPAERMLAETLVRNWQATIRAAFWRHGWTVDSTHDLSRVLRLPGTLNMKRSKDGTPLPTVPVRIAPQSSQDENLSDLAARAPYYNPSDFDDYLSLDLGLPVPPAKAAVYHADLVLDPNAQPPEAHEYLLVNNKQYGLTWERKRTFPSDDDSPSVYDLALANILAKAGYTDQQIVDTCIAWRRKHGYDDAKKVTRYDYWTKYVLGKVRTGHTPELQRVNGETQDSAAAQARAAAQATEAAHREAQALYIRATENTENDGVARGNEQKTAREALLAVLSQDLGIEIERVERLMTDPPEFYIVVNSRPFLVGKADDFFSPAGQRHLYGVILNEFSKTMMLKKNDQWQPFVQTLRLAAFDVEVGRESTKAGQALVWLSQYLTDRYPPAENASKALEGGMWPFLDDEGRTVIFAPHFATNVTLSISPGTKRPFVFECLRAFGAVHSERNLKNTIRKTRSNYDLYTLPYSPVVPIGPGEPEG